MEKELKEMNENMKVLVEYMKSMEKSLREIRMIVVDKVKDLGL